MNPLSLVIHRDYRFSRFSGVLDLAGGRLGLRPWPLGVPVGRAAGAGRLLWVAVDSLKPYVKKVGKRSILGVGEVWVMFEFSVGDIFRAADDGRERALPMSDLISGHL